MGLCYSCFKASSVDYTTPDMETRRRQQAEAAERRMQEQESRGIKDPNKVKQQLKKKEEIERRQEEAMKQNVEGGLRWQVD